MTDLNRFKIEQYRQCVAEDAFEDALCDMALRTHDAEQRVQRAEAECERLRRSLQNVMVHTGHTKTSPDRLHMELLDHIAQIVSNALTTPPPEKPQAPTIEELHEERKRWRPDAPQTPEQTECASCGEGMPRDECPESKRPCGHHCNHSWTQDICHWCGKEFGEETDEPEQAHGDALAALDRILLRGDNAKCGDFQIVRNALTASGVPGHWACKNPGRADQYRAEAMACRRALGFDEESHDVSPSDLASAIADSGVPYVPDEVRRLPERMRENAASRKDQAASIAQGDEEKRAYIRGQANAVKHWAEQAESALASAPAVNEWVQPAWQPIDTYPKDQGVYRNGTRAWLWHEDLGVCWGFIDDLPSGLRCEVYRKQYEHCLPLDSGVKAARKLRYWMPAAPAMPEPPIAAAPTDGRE